VPCDEAPFQGLLLVSTGESYVKICSPVPMTPPTRTFVLEVNVGWPAGTAQTSDVSDLNDVVTQAVEPMSAVEVVSDSRKFMPASVIVVPAVTGEFSAAAKLTTGGSYVNADVREWAAPLIVVMTSSAADDRPVPVKHWSCVAELHETVRQELPPMDTAPAVRDTSTPPKLRPNRVIGCPPVAAELAWTMNDVTGESNEKEYPVFSLSATFAPIARPAPAP